MVRLPLLVVAALVLTAVGTRPGERLSRTPAPSIHTGALLPHPGLPRPPRFGRARILKSRMAQVDRRLRDLVVQQETWFAQHGTYGQEADQVGRVVSGDSVAARLVRVQILYAGKQAWSALGSHPDVPGRTCVVYVGVRDRLPIIPRSRANGHTATMEGIPACDD